MEFWWIPNTSLWVSFVVIFFIWFLQYLWMRHRFCQCDQIPGPKGWPVIGNMLDFLGSTSDIFDKVMEYFSQYPGLFKVRYGPSVIYGISHPEYTKIVMTSSKSLSRKFFQKYSAPILGNGLVTAPVPIWKRHRKLIMPTFRQMNLDGFVEIFGKQSIIMGEQLEKYVGKGEFDVFDLVTRCTIDAICETTMRIEVNTQSTDSEFSHWMERLSEILILRMAVIWYHFDFIYKWTKLWEEQSQLVKKFNGFTENIIKARRSTSDEKIKPKAFLDLLGTNDNIRDEVNTLLLTGSDTTGVSASFIFVILGMYPDIQNRIYEEAIEILGPDRMVHSQDLPHFKYTERVIKETLRLFPVVTCLIRDLEDDLPLNDDLILSKGSIIFVSLMQLHRDPKYWPDPLKFDADRFLPEEVAKRHPYSYLPFSGGPRNCIGNKYAMMILKSIVATIIRKFQISSSYKSIEDIRVKVHTTLRMRDGFKISLELREKLI